MTDNPARRADMTEIVIGIAAGRKYENYLNWISKDTRVKVVKLGHEDQNFESIAQCDGVVLCGGEDVHPRYYHQKEYVGQYHLDDIDPLRDEFEMEILSYTQQNHLPLLGICRGLQITNVFFGGKLIPDIPSFGKPDHTKYKEGKDRYHTINVKKGSLLNSIAGVEVGEINSAHHQSVDTVGEGLVVNALSPDGIVEGLERTLKEGQSYLLLVQWHPERMIDQESVFSKNIRENFLDNVRKSHN